MKAVICTSGQRPYRLNLGFFVEWHLSMVAKHANRSRNLLRAGAYDLPENVGGSYARRRWQARASDTLRKLHLRLRREYDAGLVHMNPESTVLGGAFGVKCGKQSGLWYEHGASTPSCASPTFLPTYVFHWSRTEAAALLAESEEAYGFGHGIALDAARGRPGRGGADTLRPSCRPS